MAAVTRGDVLQNGPVFYGVLNGTVSKGDPIGTNGTNWVRADADAVISCQAFALADGESGDTIPMTQFCVQQTSYDLTVGNMLWLSTTPGRIDDADPGAATIVSQVLGWVVRGATTETMYLSATIPHIEASVHVSHATLITTSDLGNFFVAARQCRVIGAREVHDVAGSDGSAVTLTVEKLTSGTDKGSGVNVLSTTFNLKSTADTPVWVGPTTTVANARLVPGDRLGLLSSGTLTAIVDVGVTVLLVPWER